MPLSVGGGAGSSSNTMSHAKFHLDPSNRLATVHQVPDWQTGQDRQRSDSIGRTVLQTVAQKSANFSNFWYTEFWRNSTLVFTKLSIATASGQVRRKWNWVYYSPVRNCSLWVPTNLENCLLYAAVATKNRDIHNWLNSRTVGQTFRYVFAKLLFCPAESMIPYVMRANVYALNTSRRHQ